MIKDKVLYPKINDQMIKEHGLSVDEYNKILNILDREPTFVELGIFSVMWSEHCSYKSSIKMIKTLPRSGGKLLVDAGVTPTENEWLAIRLHDGLYDPANEPYLKSWMPELKPRTSLIYIIHQADLMAARIEFEMWYKNNPSQNKSVKRQYTKKVLTDSTTKVNAQEMFKDLFGDNK